MLYYCSQQEAEKEFRDTLVKFAESDGYQGCYGPKETHKKLVSAVNWAQKSRTAREIFEFVALHPRRIIVVGMKGGFQSFSSTEGDKKLQVVYIDLDAKLTINARTPHNLHFDPSARLDRGLKDEPRLHIEPEKWGNLPTVELENNIALLHELGHAKQWLERPQMFDGDYRAGGLDFTRALRTHAEQVVKSGKGPFSEPASETRMYSSERLAGFPSPVPTKKAELEEIQKTRPKWSVHIESDNMARHEWPICKELGLPYRQNYRDVNTIKSDGAPSAGVDPGGDSLIRRLVAAKKKKEAEEAAQKAAELAALAAKGNKCDWCNVTFPDKKSLQEHKRKQPRPAACKPKT